MSNSVAIAVYVVLAVGFWIMAVFFREHEIATKKQKHYPTQHFANGNKQELLPNGFERRTYVVRYTDDNSNECSGFDVVILDAKSEVVHYTTHDGLTWTKEDFNARTL